MQNSSVEYMSSILSSYGASGTEQNVTGLILPPARRDGVHEITVDFTEFSTTGSDAYVGIAVNGNIIGQGHRQHQNNSGGIYIGSASLHAKLKLEKDDVVSLRTKEASGDYRIYYSSGASEGTISMSRVGD